MTKLNEVLQELVRILGNERYCCESWMAEDVARLIEESPVEFRVKIVKFVLLFKGFDVLPVNNEKLTRTYEIGLSEKVRAVIGSGWGRAAWNVIFRNMEKRVPVEEMAENISRLVAERTCLERISIFSRIFCSEMCPYTGRMPVRLYDDEIAFLREVFREEIGSFSREEVGCFCNVAFSKRVV